MKQKITTIDKRDIEIDILPNTLTLQLREALHEFVRLFQLTFTKRRWKNHNSIWKERGMYFTDGSWALRPTTLDERLFIFVTDFFRTVKKNAFKYARCTHPHECVYGEIEGDDEIGFVRQTLCGRCGDYVGPEDIDRYRPEADRKPEDISPPTYYPRDYLKYGGKVHVTLEVGKTYETRAEDDVEIVGTVENDDSWKFIDKNGNLYTQWGGRQRFHPMPGDIIREKNPFANILQVG